MNNEAIYDTRLWKIFGEGPTEVNEAHFTDSGRSVFTGQEIRFTSKDDTLYVLV